LGQNTHDGNRLTKGQKINSRRKKLLKKHIAVPNMKMI